jgi:hypothetical protein
MTLCACVCACVCGLLQCSLSQNRIDGRGAKAVAAALVRLRKLQTLKYFVSLVRPAMLLQGLGACVHGTAAQ